MSTLPWYLLYGSWRRLERFGPWGKCRLFGTQREASMIHDRFKKRGDLE